VKVGETYRTPARDLIELMSFDESSAMWSGVHVGNGPTEGVPVRIAEETLKLCTRVR
jgi:hypothetical protein